MLKDVMLSSTTRRRWISLLVTYIGLYEIARSSLLDWRNIKGQLECTTRVYELPIDLGLLVSSILVEQQTTPSSDGRSEIWHGHNTHP